MYYTVLGWEQSVYLSSSTCRCHFFRLFFPIFFCSHLFSCTVEQTAGNKRPLILSLSDLTNPPGTVSSGEQLALKKGVSDWDLLALKGVSVLCNMAGGAAWLQQCRCCPGFSLSIAAAGTKPITSNGAKNCGHTIAQELLCVIKDSELVL